MSPQLDASRVIRPARDPINQKHFRRRGSPATVPPGGERHIIRISSFVLAGAIANPRDRLKCLGLTCQCPVHSRFCIYGVTCPESVISQGESNFPMTDWMATAYMDFWVFHGQQLFLISASPIRVPPLLRLAMPNQGRLSLRPACWRPNFECTIDLRADSDVGDYHKMAGVQFGCTVPQTIQLWITCPSLPSICGAFRVNILRRPHSSSMAAHAEMVSETCKKAHS
jgi:hypothetical protein